MDAVRFIPPDAIDPEEPCRRCGSSGCRWDRLGRVPVCPQCQEDLAQGLAGPFVARADRCPCAACGHVGAVSFLTYPLGSRAAVEIDLCPDHFRALLGRALEPSAYRVLRRALQRLRLTPRNVFLLHEAFYDDLGQALQPVAP